MSEEPRSELRERISELVRGKPSSFSRVTGGYTAAGRWRFLANGASFFAKIATTPRTREWLRHEFRAYDNIHGDFMPIRIAASDHETEPILILEDLTTSYWPPPWKTGQIDAVLAQIEKIHASSAQLPRYEDVHGQSDLGWQTVARDKHAFLSLGLVSDAWLQYALPDLLGRESRCVTAGNAVTHWDIRSDNICIGSGCAKLIDWNYACLSNPKLDLGAWLPSLAFEGGPAPDSILEDEPEIAAFLSGYFAARAGLPRAPDAPRVRIVQRQQLEPALMWAIRAIGLPAPT